MVETILGVVLVAIFAIALIVVGLFCIHCLVEREDERGLNGMSDEELLDHIRKSVSCL